MGIYFPPYNPPHRSAVGETNASHYDMRNDLRADNTPLLDARQEQYLEWLVTPASERTPRTQAEFARMLNVDPTTLRRWEKKDWFKVEWDRRVSEIQGSPERTQRLLDSLYAKAIEGDNKAAQLYLQATNRLLPAPTVVNASRASDLSDDELDALIVSIAEHQSKRKTEPPKAV